MAENSVLLLPCQLKIFSGVFQSRPWMSKSMEPMRRILRVSMPVVQNQIMKKIFSVRANSIAA